MPVVEYADAEDAVQGNIPPIEIDAARNIPGVSNSKKSASRPIGELCPLCLNYHPAVAPEASIRQRRLRLATPLHASQVPSQGEYLLRIVERYPVLWRGYLALKNDMASVQMHFLIGNRFIVEHALPFHLARPLRIDQRMRLEPLQLEHLSKKMEICYEYCMLFALPCGRDQIDVLVQAISLKARFITYFKEKQAAGIVDIRVADSYEVHYVVHIIPSCGFANMQMARVAPDLLQCISDVPYFLIIITAV